MAVGREGLAVGVDSRSAVRRADLKASRHRGRLLSDEDQLEDQREHQAQRRADPGAGREPEGSGSEWLHDVILWVAWAMWRFTLTERRRDRLLRGGKSLGMNVADGSRVQFAACGTR